MEDLDQLKSALKKLLESNKEEPDKTADSRSKKNKADTKKRIHLFGKNGVAGKKIKEE